MARWCALAEQRLEHLKDLFESGRWRRYHSEQTFLDNIGEAKKALETWRNLLSREASSDNRAIDLSWLGRRRTTPTPEGELWCDPVPLARGAETAREAWPKDPVVLESNIKEMVDALSALPRDEVAPQPGDEATSAIVSNLITIAERYPLLRNAL